MKVIGWLSKNLSLSIPIRYRDSRTNPRCFSANSFVYCASSYCRANNAIRFSKDLWPRAFPKTHRAEISAILYLGGFRYCICSDGTFMRNLSIALALSMTAFGEAGAQAALLIALAYIIQVQSAAWYVKLSTRFFP